MRAMNQRDTMLALIRKHGHDSEKVCSEYSRIEERGEVARKSNQHGITPQNYARGLWKDGIRKGWIVS
jgi:hypothetical protein